MSRKKIDNARLVKLWADGVRSADIAAELDVSRSAISQAVRRLELPKRDRERRPTGRISIPKEKPAQMRAPSLPKPQTREGSGWTKADDAAVRATDGHYAKIADLSDEIGRSSRSILGRWHVIKGRK